MVARGYLFRELFSMAEVVSYEPGPTKVPTFVTAANNWLASTKELCAKVWHYFLPIWDFWEYLAGPGLMLYAIYCKNILSCFNFFYMWNFGPAGNCVLCSYVPGPGWLMLLWFNVVLLFLLLPVSSLVLDRVEQIVCRLVSKRFPTSFD